MTRITDPTEAGKDLPMTVINERADWILKWVMDKYCVPLTYYAMRLARNMAKKNNMFIEDAVNMAFMEYWYRTDGQYFESESHLKNYLYRATFCRMEYLMRGYWNQKRAAFESKPIDYSESFLKEIEFNERMLRMLNLVADNLDYLSPMRKRALSKRVLENKPMRTIAAEMNITHAAAKLLVNKSVGLLKRILVERDTPKLGFKPKPLMTNRSLDKLCYSLKLKGYSFWEVAIMANVSHEEAKERFITERDRYKK